MGIKVAFFATTSNLDSGATWSLLRLVINLKNIGVNPIVFLQKHGNVEEKLTQYSIPFYITNEKAFDTWIIKDSDKNTIKSRVKGKIKNFLNIYSYLRIKRIIKKENVNIIHLNALPTYLGAKVAINNNIKFIWHIREFMEEDLGLSFVNNSAYDLLSKSNAIIAISNSVANVFENKVEKSKVHVIYNGVEIDKYYKNRSIFLANTNKTTISIVGRIVPQKGQMDLLQAINNLPSKLKDNIRCNVIGAETKYSKELKEYAKNNKLKINFVNYTPNVEKYMQQSDIICVCSKKEAFGRVTIEGMLSGACIVGSNSGGTAELIRDKETGYLYDVNDVAQLTEKLNYIINHKKEAQDIALNGQKFARRNFTDFQNAKKIYDLYNKIMR